MGVITVCNTVFQSMISCSSREMFAIKSQNGVVENYVFWPKNFFRGEVPLKSDADILCPYGDTSSRTVWRIAPKSTFSDSSPNRSQRYKL